MGQQLGVKLKKVIGFEEFNNSPGPYPYATVMDRAAGIGGAVPEVQPGTEEVNVQVSITYLLGK